MTTPRRLRLARTALLFATPLLAAAPARAVDGAALYAEHCAVCHGANLEGEPDWRIQKPDGTLPAPPHDDSGHTWHHPDQMLRDYVRLGGVEALRRMGVTSVTSAMPAFGGLLSDREIEAILDHIKGSWSPRARDYQRKVTETNQ